MMLRYKQSEWEHSPGNALAYFAVSCFVFQVAGGMGFTVIAPDCFVNEEAYIVQCNVDETAIAAEGCLVIQKVLLQLIGPGQSDVTQLASSSYAQCNSDWIDNGRCLDKNTKVSVYAMRFLANLTRQNGLSLKCWSDCIRLQPISLTYDTSSIPFGERRPCLKDPGIAVVCVGVILLVTAVTTGVIMKTVLFKGSCVSVLGIAGILLVCCGSALLVIAGGLFMSEECNRSLCDYSTVQIAGIVLAAIGGAAVIVGIIIIIVVCINRCLGTVELNEFWMRDLPERLQKGPLYKLAIPGTHNSGTYLLRPDWQCSPDAGPIVKTLCRCPCLVRKILLNYGKCQNLSITGQLRAGIRYFDLRVAFRKEDDHYYICHSLYGPEVSEVLNEVKHFLEQHEKDAVLLDFKHVYMDNDKHEGLKDILEHVFNDKLCFRHDYGSAKDITLCGLWQKKKQVIVFYGGRFKFWSSPDSQWKINWHMPSVRK